MKKFYLKIALFFAIIVVVDFAFGHACDYMNDHSKGGGIKSRHYACKESNEDILLFGSSRCKHHYVPQIFEDTLQATCYNTGEDGNGIIFSYGFLQIIVQRYTPKLILYDVSGFDIYQDDNMKYLNLMKPYYHEPGIDSIFWSVSKTEREKMLSNLYRYNTTCLRVIGDYVHPANNYPKGYSPLFNVMDYEPEEKKDTATHEVDALKMRMLKDFIVLCKQKGIPVVFYASPSYHSTISPDYYEPAKEVCASMGVPFEDYSSLSEICTNRSYFQDRTHMNDDGARRYSSMVASQLERLIREGQIPFAPTADTVQ